MAFFDTVADAIKHIGERFPDHGYVFQDSKGDETFVPYPEVDRLTARRAAALQALGLTKGDRVGLVVVEPQDFVLSFLAAVRVGIIPVPLYPPLGFGALDAYADRTARVLELSGARVLVASAQLQNVLWGLVDRVSTLERLVRAEDLAKATGAPIEPPILPSDTAFLQYTSGSTADPKGVVVTHANLIANCDGIINTGLEMEGWGVAVSWLPLYHDMGLIGFVISTICHGLTSVFIPTMRFIRRPTVWFDAITKHKANVTFAPNFAYALIARKAKDDDIARWDLSSMRAFGCGAEPIHPNTARAFEARFAGCGLSETAFLPAYGMAEATLAISFKPIADPHRTRVVDADTFTGQGRAVVPEDDTVGNVLEHVSCGVPFPGHAVTAQDEHGTVLPDGVEGELCFRGPSVAAGYFENPEATADCFRPDGWLRTGDLGYVLDGEVYVTGRIKDLIILNGRNLHPQAIEWVVAEVPGVRKGNVVAFSVPGAEAEELVVVVETKDTALDALIDAVAAAVRKEIGAPPADVVCLPPGSLPKTSSGKLQRRKTRQQYLRGELGEEGTRTLGAQGNAATVARHLAKGLLTRARTRLLGSR